MALLLDVTLVTDLDHVLADAFACFIKRALQNVVREGEAGDGSDCLSECDEVQGYDCNFH